MATTKELEKMHEDLAALIQEVQMDVKKLELRFEQVKERLDHKRKMIQDLDELLHDPDKGLFKRINDLNNELSQIASVNDTLNDLERKVNENDFIVKNLTKIAGERLENLDSTIKTSQNSKKILWAFVVGAAGIAAEQLIKFL